MFFECESLKYIRDISKWNTEKVKRMDYMFCYCRSISILPDLSKWNLKSLESAYNTITYCASLTSFPNLNLKKNVARESIKSKINNALFYRSDSEDDGDDDYDKTLDEDEIQNRIKNLDDDDIVLHHRYERYINNDN